MDINIVQILFLSFAVITAIVWFLISTQADYVPVMIVKIYRYGKSADLTEHKLASKFELPKRWFKHFYCFAGPTGSFVVAVMISRYIFHYPMPDFLRTILDLGFGSGRKALVSPESSLMAMILFNLHCWKRFYESNYVSVYSDGKMSLSVYILGFVHYAGTISSLVGEAEGFVAGSDAKFHWDRITNFQWMCAIIFLLATYEQLKHNVILANLRKDKSGKVVTKSHKIPQGRLFEYITSPLQFTEIIVYAMLWMIMWSGATYHYVFIWVFLNQVETASMAHEWYLKEFPNYAKHRKIIIPYLY